jgi:hypothetical protein
MSGQLYCLLLAAFLTGAAGLSPSFALAGSCCGGGTAAALVLPPHARAMADVSADVEKYRGFWNQNGKHTPDASGSDLRQYRLNLGYARRLAPRWQASVIVPYVRNVNRYSSGSFRQEGLGDATLSLWYEAFDDLTAWKVRRPRDMTPSVMIGPSLLVPTGISPYDGVRSDDVTGRGFYRLDGNALISKTLHPWSVSLSASCGTYLERSVNREEQYVQPYRKKLGDRLSATLSLSYIYYLGSAGDTLTATASIARLKEQDATIDGARIQNSGFRKDSAGGAIVYSSTDHDWALRASWNHAVRQDGWGENFPTTDIYTLGASYVFR